MARVLLCKKSGGVLLSQAVSDQVPSALEGLTSVFGMGTGVTPPIGSPESCVLNFREEVKEQEMEKSE